MAREYIIYADESAASGRYFSNFYGGALVRSSDIDHVRQVLEAVKEDHYLRDEIKWSKVTAQYLSKYTNVIDTFFDLIEADRVKIRIMFTQNRHIPQKLNEDQIDNHYFLLYYQFIKHAFGLQYSNLLEGV